MYISRLEVHLKHYHEGKENVAVYDEEEANEPQYESLSLFRYTATSLFLSFSLSHYLSPSYSLSISFSDSYSPYLSASHSLIHSYLYLSLSSSFSLSLYNNPLARLVVHCVCGEVHQDTLLIQCDECCNWLHGQCINVVQSTIPSQYICPYCYASVKQQSNW